LKFVTDLLPVIVFFAVYQLSDIYIATLGAILASIIQVAYLKLRNGQVETMHWATLGLLIVFGGMTLALHDPLFIKWKPTLVNWLFAAAFLLSHRFMARGLLQRMMDRAISLPDPVWTKLNVAWVAFFLSIGLLNLYVAYGFSEQVWVSFKLFGLLILTLLFMLAQGVYLSRHLITETAQPED
jgi:intracellular septation protein